MDEFTVFTSYKTRKGGMAGSLPGRRVRKRHVNFVVVQFDSKVRREKEHGLIQQGCSWYVM
ncbi:hypothetical protein EJB05_09830, partial [Eragrostis curvula]